jgi:hypothetical protein
MLGFTGVYDYVFGKVDWLSHRLPVEGERSDPPTVGRLMRDDVVQCAPSERVSDVLDRIERAVYVRAGDRRDRAAARPGARIPL